MNAKKLKKLRKEFRSRGIDPLSKEDLIDEEGAVWVAHYNHLYKQTIKNCDKHKVKQFA